jgi:KipI family sensor histidine kinase inhibitor
MKLLACGDAALLIEVDGLRQALALTEAVRGAGWVQVWDVVPAASTVLLHTEPGTDLLALGRAVRELPVDGAAAVGVHARGDTVELDVVYDGPDLAEVAALTGLDVAQVVAAHTAGAWRVAFGGFAPGFAYLTGGDPRLQVPRRAEPRTKVPVGAVGLAGEFSGVYPRASPGGWQLIGRTEATLWDVDRDPPALLHPGGWVRFRSIR